MARIRANYVFGTISTTGGINAAATAFDSAELTRLPAVVSPDVAAVTLYDSTTDAYEIVHVTAHTAAATTATVLRGQEGTTAQTWAEDATWTHGLTAADMTAANIPFTPTGTVAATDVQSAIAEVASEAGSGGGGGGTTPTEYDPTVARAAGLQSWHRCDTGLTLSGNDVTAWADKRGSGPDFTLPGGATAPKKVAATMGGATAVNALGFKDARLVASAFTPASGATARTLIAVVLSFWGQAGTSGAYRHLLHYGSQSPSQAYGIVSSDGVLGNHYWSGGTQSWFPAWTREAAVFATRYTGTVDQQFLNGIPGPTQTITLNTGTSDGTIIGSRLSPQAEGAYFIMTELITWNQALTDAEIKDAADKLLSWWAQ